MKLKHVIFFACITLFSSLIFALPSVDSPTITIVNHFNQPLMFTKHINPDVLRDLSGQFMLAQGGEISTQIIDLQKKAYVRVEDNNAHSAYWGIKVENGQSDIHGYISKGIAFSWNKSKIVFCTPEEYKQHKTCLQ